MRPISAALARRLFPGLAEGLPQAGGLRAWLESGSYFVDASSSPNDVRLKNIQLSEAIPFLSFDFERFTFASFESFLHSTPSKVRPRAVSWPLLQMYYSSFFGAHALMRGVGKGIFRVEADQAKRLTDIASIFIGGVTIDSGTFEFEFVQNSDHSIDLVLKRISDSGGAHEQFWKKFYSFLSSFSQTVSDAREIDANAVVGEIFQIQSLLAASGFTGGTWLSATRNKINYQHALGVWYPYDFAHDVMDCFGPNREKPGHPVRLDYNASKQPIQAFDACCRFIANINSDVSSTLASRKGARRFTQLWQRLGQNG